MSDHIMQTYARLPVEFVRGEGVWLWDKQDRAYLDALSGIGVCGLGHAHPAVRAAIDAQAGRLIHTSNLYRIGPQRELAARLTELSGLDKVFFCNSGAEANEAALKIARRYGHRRGVEAPVVIAMENSFHGRTLATLSASGNPRIQQGFEPLVAGFLHVPFDDVAALEASGNPDIVAVLVEPIQGEGGVRVPSENYLPALRRLCDSRGWLLMLDEVQTGIGRTGKFLAFQHRGISPDVCTLAKGLGNGVPIGACLARGGAAEVLTAGAHGSTFGGNPLACGAALATLDALERDHLCERAARLGAFILSRLRDGLAGNPHVTAIRGQGLILGIELDRPCKELMERALEQQLLINVTAENVIRLLPPLVMSDGDAEFLIERLRRLIDTFTRHGAP